MRVNKCIECDKRFRSIRKSLRCPSCQNEREKARRREWARRNYALKKYKYRTRTSKCLDCGDEIIVGHNEKKYCDACRIYHAGRYGTKRFLDVLVKEGKLSCDIACAYAKGRVSGLDDWHAVMDRVRSRKILRDKIFAETDRTELYQTMPQRVIRKQELIHRMVTRGRI